MLYEYMARGTPDLSEDDPGYIPSLNTLLFEAGWLQLVARVITRAEFEAALGLPANDSDLTELLGWYQLVSVTTGGPAALDAFATNVARSNFSTVLRSISIAAERKEFGLTTAVAIRQRIIDMRPFINDFNFDPSRP